MCLCVCVDGGVGGPARAVLARGGAGRNGAGEVGPGTCAWGNSSLVLNDICSQQVFTADKNSGRAGADSSRATLDTQDIALSVASWA